MNTLNKLSMTFISYSRVFSDTQAIINNPYRITGILVGATAKEQSRQIKHLKQYLEAEQEPPADFSFPVFGPLFRTVDCVTEAASKLNLDRDKMDAALFWFYKGNAITDEPAFEALKDGDTHIAIDIWKKLTASGEVTKRNASAFQNLSTFLLLDAPGYSTSQQGIIMKLKFLESDFVQDFKAIATDATFEITKKELQLTFLSTFFAELEKKKRKGAFKVLFDILKPIEFQAKQEFLKNLVRKPIEAIQTKINATYTKRKNNSTNAATFGKILCEETSEDIVLLKSVLCISDIAFSSISDKLAQEILQCGIDYFNHYKDSDTDPGVTVMDLFKKAKILAVGNIAKQRCEENIEGLEGWQQQAKAKKYLDNLLLTMQLFEIEKTSDIILNTKKFINQTRPDLINIKAILGSTDNTYIGISTKIGMLAQQYIIEEVNNLQIRHYNNLSLLKDTLKGAWQVTQLIEALDMESTYWTHHKRNKDTLKNICNQLNISTPEYNFPKIPQLDFIIIDSAIMNEDKNGNSLPTTDPLYKKYVRYVSLNIQVEVLRKKTVTIYEKYITPCRNIVSNSKSPAGYTLSKTIEINVNMKNINLSGWGNPDECTYELGRHSIEIWIDNCMIHKKEFVVNLAPSEKLEIDLRKAEEKYEEIKNTQFYTSELNKAKSKMKEIMEFQWFRSNTTRAMQISEQEKNIAKLKEKAEKEKTLRLFGQQAVIDKLKTDIQNAKY